MGTVLRSEGLAGNILVRTIESAPEPELIRFRQIILFPRDAIMNYVRFLTEVDTLAGERTHAQLCAFLHEYARTLPEGARLSFCNHLRNAIEFPADHTASFDEEDASVTADLMQMVEDARSLMAKVPDQYVETITISEFNEREEEYDEFYENKDPFDLLPGLSQVCTLIHILVDHELFAPASALGQQLLSLKITVHHIYQREDEEESLDVLEKSLFDISNLFSTKLDLRSVLLDTAAAAYHVDENPARTLLDLIHNPAGKGLKLADLLEHMDEKRDRFASFLTEWIRELKRDSSAYGDSLFREALSLLPASEAVECVRDCVETHPTTYIYLLGRADLSQDDRCDLALEGLDRIPENEKDLRHTLALRTAFLIQKLNRPMEMAESLWLKAFDADPSATDFLRVLLNVRDPEDGLRQLDLIASRHAEAGSPVSWKIRFLQGHFQDVFHKILEPSVKDRWQRGDEDTDAIFLAALYAGKRPSKIASHMLKTAEGALHFYDASYLNGLPPADPLPKRASLFRICLARWKELVPFPQELQEPVLDTIEKKLSFYVQDITSAGSVKLYKGAATRIAALGEVRESLGMTGAKAQIIDSYLRSYRRYSRMKYELEKFL